jgi:hypothetical protein
VWQAGAHLGKETGSGLHESWQRVDACLAPCLDLKLYVGVPGL